MISDFTSYQKSQNHDFKEKFKGKAVNVIAGK